MDYHGVRDIAALFTHMHSDNIWCVRVCLCMCVCVCVCLSVCVCVCVCVNMYEN